MTFEQFEAEQARLTAAWDCRLAEQSATRARLALAMGIEESGPMGLTAEPVRLHPEYRTAAAHANVAFQALRAFNAKHAKRFRKQAAAAVMARRLAKLQAAA